MSRSLRRFAVAGALAAGWCVAAGLAPIYTARGEEDRRVGRSTPRTTARRIFRGRSDQQGQRREPARRVEASAGGSGDSGRQSRSSALEQVHGVAHHGERRAATYPMASAWSKHGSGNRPDVVDADAAGPGTEACSAAARTGASRHWRQGTDARIYTTRAQYLFALDAKNGQPIADFGDGGKVDLNVGLGPLMKAFRWSGVPLVVRDVVVIGSSMLEQDSARTMEGPPGDVRAYDIRTGKLRWTFHVIPHAGEPGVETWENKSYDLHRRRQRLVDDERRRRPRIRVPADVGRDQRHVRRAPSGQQPLHELDRVPRREDRQDASGTSRRSTTICSTTTIRRRRFWWTSRWTGGAIKALAQVTKQGFVFVLDRVTGKPVWPIEERPVPASTVPGEKASPTQPIPTKPPPFERQGLQDDDLIDFTPELRAEALEIIKQVRHRSAVYAAVGTRRRRRREEGHASAAGLERRRRVDGRGVRSGNGMLYIPSKTNPFAADLLKGNRRRPTCATAPASRALVAGPRGLPLTKPPTAASPRST